MSFSEAINAGANVGGIPANTVRLRCQIAACKALVRASASSAVFGLTATR